MTFNPPRPVRARPWQLSKRDTVVPFLIGVFLAIAVGLMATWAGIDRERGFYPVVLIVIASYYDLFAVTGGSREALIAEMVPFVLFLFVALLGFKKNLWLVVAALAGHGVFDFKHSRLIADPGVPVWWPMFCLSYDFTAGPYLAWCIKKDAVPAASASEAQCERAMA
jgi:hypothetical protein